MTITAAGLIDGFDVSAERCPHRLALIGDTVSSTYAEADRSATRLAAAMARCGLAPGERVAIYSDNDVRMLLAIAAVGRAGAVWVPLSPLAPLASNERIMRHARISWLIHGGLASDDVCRIRQVVPSLRSVRQLDALAELEAEYPADSPWSVVPSTAARTAGDAVVMVPTGATTGEPRLVVHTRHSWNSVVEALATCISGPAAAPVCLTATPLAHVAGLFALTTLRLGASQVVHPRFEADEVLDAIESWRVTHLCLPPTCLYALLRAGAKRRVRVDSLECLLVTGGPVAAEQLLAAVELFGPSICHAYGQVETGNITWLDQTTIGIAAARGDRARLRSCGRPIPPVTVTVMDGAGRTLPQGECGEIVVRGSTVSPAVRARPEDWHRTGDIGYLDADGFLHVVDRAKDVIISGGLCIYSIDVEAAIHRLADVDECAVVGLPDERWGERTVAAIRLKPDAALTSDAVIAHCRRIVGSPRSPKQVAFVARLPRTAVGKIDKRALRAQLRGVLAE
jgi:acyl-CoA synthetase (AMP-forming)/AMP-acid ligase II